MDGQERLKLYLLEKQSALIPRTQHQTHERGEKTYQRKLTHQQPTPINHTAAIKKATFQLNPEIRLGHSYPIDQKH